LFSQENGKRAQGFVRPPPKVHRQPTDPNPKPGSVRHMQAPGTWEPVFGWARREDGRRAGWNWRAGRRRVTHSYSIVVFDVEVVVIVVVEGIIVAVVFVGHSCGRCFERFVVVVVVVVSETRKYQADRRK
jgi:hypothetical protein